MSDGQTGFGHIWASGRSGYSRFSVSGGILSEISGGLCLYAGAGYGRVGCFWEDVSGQWAKVKDKSFKGLMVESGVILTVWKIAIMTGVSSVSFSSLSPAVGVGVYF